MEREIITADGERRTITGDTITEFEGTVYVFPADATVIDVLTRNCTVEKYTGASLA